MPLIVEDGSGRPDADSYVSVESADAYHAAMGNSGWAGTADEKAVALRKATQYIDTHYGAAFTGSVRTITQRLLWPRLGVYVNDILVSWWPIYQLSNATCELALRSLMGTDLFADVDDTVKTRVTVGPITTEYGSMGQRGQKRFTVVDRIIAPLVQGASGLASAIRLERA